MSDRHNPATPKWTPLHLTLLLHYYVSPEDHRQIDSSAGSEFIKQLVDCQLLAPSTDKAAYPATWMVTERGKAFIELMSRTPLPVLRFTDPRNNTVLP